MGNFMSISEIANSVPVKNRYTDAEVTIIHDREPLTWAPQETKYLPKAYAQFFLNKSTRKRDLKGKAKVQVLVIVGGGKDESDLSIEQFKGPQQLIDKPWFDKDGTPLKEKYVDVNATGVEQVACTVDNKEAQAREGKASAAREKVAEKVADDAMQAISELAGDAKAAS
jgi:hypothetical protein